MLTIKTAAMTITTKANLLALQPSASMCYIKFADHSELTITQSISPKLQNALALASISTAKNIEIDFTNESTPIRLGG